MSNIKKLTILHSNDLHGDFLAEEVDAQLIGGVSMLSGYVGKVRREEKNAIYCIAGDMFRGSVIDSEFRGISTIEIMNMLAPDVVTIGNHEIDYEEVAQNGKPRQVATSCREVLDEYLSCHQNLDHHISGRLKIE